eukprot:3941985-Rhodomonas_salina.6
MSLRAPCYAPNPKGLRAPYAVSGTEMADGGVRQRERERKEKEQREKQERRKAAEEIFGITLRDVLRRPTQCPVSSYTMSATFPRDSWVSYYATSGIVLRPPYAVSGTDRARVSRKEKAQAAAEAKKKRGGAAKFGAGQLTYPIAERACYLPTPSP